MSISLRQAALMQQAPEAQLCPGLRRDPRASRPLCESSGRHACCQPDIFGDFGAPPASPCRGKRSLAVPEEHIPPAPLLLAAFPLVLSPPSLPRCGAARQSPPRNPPSSRTPPLPAPHTSLRIPGVPAAGPQDFHALQRCESANQNSPLLDVSCCRDSETR